MADEALRPVLNIPSYIQDKTDVEVLTDEEKILAAGSGNEFWKTLKKHFDNEMEILEKINEAAISNGMTLEEIGRNAIVVSQVKGVLHRIINVVEDAKEEALSGGKTK